MAIRDAENKQKRRSFAPSLSLQRSENHEGDLIAGIPSQRSIYREDDVGEGGREDSIQYEAGEVRRGCKNHDNTGSPTFTDLGLKEAKHMVEKLFVVDKKGPTSEEAIPMFKTQEFGTTSVFCIGLLEIEDEGLGDAEGKGNVGSVPGVGVVDQFGYYQVQQWRGIRVKVFNGNLEQALSLMQRKMTSSEIERLIKRQETHHIKNSEKRVLARKNLERRLRSEDFSHKIKAILLKKVRASPSIALPAALPDSSSPTSNSYAANVGVSLGPSQPTTTPPLTPIKSQLSPPTTLYVPSANRSPFSEMAARAARVRDFPRHTPPTIGQVSEVITSVSNFPTQQNGKTKEAEDVSEDMIELAEGDEVPATPKVKGT
ncbi:hypothetical protein LWI28_010712 [Acer negundo]|uniref:Uncharacterized protein n=1 Tax=Acer negundo TaxID=4023 RepID=A0AAD5P2S1_ACENE|nr:hypothetical protein LWI28_010712 [Acer negundo]